MTKQEAIKILKGICHNCTLFPHCVYKKPDCFRAINMAIEALSTQVEIIYCGECKHMMPDGKCRQFADSTIRPSASDFCSAGERKDNG